MKDFQDFIKQLSNEQIKRIYDEAQYQFLSSKRELVPTDETTTKAMVVAIELLGAYHNWLNN